MDKNSIAAYQGQKTHSGNLQINLQRGHDLQTTLLLIQQCLAQHGEQINDVDARDPRLNAPVVVVTSMPFKAYQECDRAAIFPAWTAAEKKRHEAERAKQERLDEARNKLDTEQAQTLKRQLLSRGPSILN